MAAFMKPSVGHTWSMGALIGKEIGLLTTETKRRFDFDDTVEGSAENLRLSGPDGV